MKDKDRRLIAQAAVATANALNRQQDVFGFGTVRPDRFLPLAIKTGQTGGNSSLGVQTPNSALGGRADRMVLLTCFTSWALDEFTSMPAHFQEKIEGYDEQTLARILAELDHRMMPFQTHAGTRAVFKNLMQGKKEGLREFSRRVRSLGDETNVNIGAHASDDMNREQFIDGLFEAELQNLLLSEGLGSLAQAVARAQALELVIKTSRARNRKRLHLARVAEIVPEPKTEVTRGANGQSGRASTARVSSG